MMRRAAASGIPEVSSDCEPFCTTSALSVRPVARNAIRKPFDIESSTMKTVTTSAIPKIASSVTCQRTRRLRML